MSLLSTRHVNNTLDVVVYVMCNEYLSFRTKGQSEACRLKCLHTKTSRLMFRQWMEDKGDHNRRALLKVHSPLNVNQPLLSSIKDNCV